jgi:hypothetical protein
MIDPRDKTAPAKAAKKARRMERLRRLLNDTERTKLVASMLGKK